MKKASTQKSQPAKLGTKRTCPSCGTKFYDFGKPEVLCPKCETELDEEALNPFVKIQNEIKKGKAAEKAEASSTDSEETVEGGSDDVIESVDELGDDEEDLVEDISTEDKDEEEDF